jgi:hypothetical protein
MYEYEHLQCCQVYLGDRDVCTSIVLIIYYLLRRNQIVHVIIEEAIL